MDISIRPRAFIDDELVGRSILPQLIDYVRIPNKSPPLRSRTGKRNGHMEAAVQLMLRWAAGPGAGRLQGRGAAGSPGRTPVLMVDVPGDVDDCVLMYGHLDKQPEFTGWSEGLDALDPGDPRRQVVWPWRRRRRLCPVLV